MGSWWVWRVATWHVPDMLTTNHQLLGAKSSFFFSWMVGDFLFWCRVIWCMGLGLTTEIVIEKNGIECQIFGMAKKPVLHWPDPRLDGTHVTGSTLQYNIQLHSGQKITFWPPMSPFLKTFEKNLALLKFCFGRSSAKFWKINFFQKRYPWGIAKMQLFCFQMYLTTSAHHGDIAQVIFFVTFQFFFPSIGVVPYGVVLYDVQP